MATNKNESINLRFNPIYKEKIDTYTNLLKENNIKKDNKLIKAPDILNNIFDDFFKDKILTNDYIPLKEPLYFDLETLIKERNIKATNEKPISNLGKKAKIIKIPNNLDKFNKNYGFCFKEKNNHLGIKPYMIPEINNNDSETNLYNLGYLIFKYNNNCLEIGILEKNMLEHYLEPIEYKEEINKLIHEEIKTHIIYENNKYSFISSYILDYNSIFELEKHIKDYAKAITDYIKEGLNYLYLKRNYYIFIKKSNSNLNKIDMEELNKKLLTAKEIEEPSERNKIISEVENKINDFNELDTEIKKEQSVFKEKEKELLKVLSEKKETLEKLENLKNEFDLNYNESDLIIKDSVSKSVIMAYLTNINTDITPLLNLVYSTPINLEKNDTILNKLNDTIKLFEEIVELGSKY